MDKKSFFDKFDGNLKKDQKCNIIKDINEINIVRMKLFLVIFIIVELLFIVFNDIPYMINPSLNTVWNDSRFLVLHLLILFISGIGLMVIRVLNKYKECRFKNVYKLLVPVLTSLILSLMAIINSLDQLIHQNISSVFIANLIIFGSAILLSFPSNLVIYSIPFFIYLGGLIVFEQNVDLLISNSINGVIFFLAVITISTVIYNHHYERLAQNIVLEETIYKLNYLSSHDPLTGLLNRRFFGDKVAEEMKTITETKKIAALILIDVDHFKNVNDKFGHPVGDIVLKEVSKILTEHIKINDLATRWGGEEFLIFVFETSADEAFALAENIRLAIQDKVILNDKSQINITASFGISLLRNNSLNSFDASYKAADVALYQAKDQGRNKVIVAPEDIDEYNK